VDESRKSHVPLRVLSAALVIAGCAVLLPLAVPLILAAWSAELSEPLVRRLERGWRGRQRAACALTLLVLVAVVGPLAAALALLLAGADDLVEKLRTVFAGGSLSAGLAEPPAPSFHGLVAWARDVAGGHFGIIAGAVRGSASALLAFAVFLAGVYTFSAHGDQARRWLQRASGIPEEAFARLAGAFFETGRGLFVGVGLTALVQGVIAAVAYIALRVPRAPLFAFLTAVAALIPGVGTALVWVPIAVVLVVSGHPIRGGILAAVGIGVISVVDNFLRPVLAHRGRLQLSPFVLFVSMLGGVVLFGAAGIVVGPLLVRMAVEVLAMAQTEHLFP
jgi:predicted PurR-regulated permease PerM